MLDGGPLVLGLDDGEALLDGRVADGLLDGLGGDHLAPGGLPPVLLLDRVVLDQVVEVGQAARLHPEKENLEKNAEKSLKSKC